MLLTYFGKLNETHLLQSINVNCPIQIRDSEIEKH